MNRRWIVNSVNLEQQQSFAKELAVLPATASVLLARGLDTLEQAREWIGPSGGVLHDPFLLPEIEVAIDRLHRAITGKELICFYGDYDVDGISATSIYQSFFQACGGSTTYYIPERESEGYGLNEQAIQALHQQGVSLMVTSDCGTLSFHEIEVARHLGIDVIVTDHHHPEAHRPRALAMINPNRADSRYPFPHLCSGGLAYKVILAYQHKYKIHDIDTRSYLDLVALSTVADVMPLQNENRALVTEGLRTIAQGTRPGIRALKQVADVGNDCTAVTLAFKLAPRINAIGRLAHAKVGVQLFTTESHEEALSLAQACDRLNKDRQAIEKKITAEALADITSATLPSAFVLAKQNWHLGVIGIVAARVVDRYGRPAIVLTINEEGIAKGSARSVAGFDLCAALESCRDVLQTFGGHPAAAGLTLKASHLPLFRERFEAYAHRHLPHQRERPDLHADAEVQLSEMNRRFIKEIDQLQPFGAGNPEPTLVVRNVSVLDARIVGDSHLKLTVRHRNSPPIQGIGFRLGGLMKLGRDTPKEVDLAFVPELNRWNGLEQVQLRIQDLQVNPKH